VVFRSKGRQPAIQKLAEATFSSGVVQADPEAAAANERGGSYGNLITIRYIDKVVELYTLRFAVDLDNGKLYLNKNNSWYGGTPGSSGGLDLMRGHAYKGQLSSSVSVNSFLASHLLDVNFGDREFTYHVPDGYGPCNPMEQPWANEMQVRFVPLILLA
jgi:hypothetical protein